jgi:trafficking protein particle complex subunit 6
MAASKPQESTEERPIHVSDSAMEFLLTEVLRWVEQSCKKLEGGGADEEAAIYAAEMAASKLERIGYSVGYRLCERLAQNKTFGSVATPSALLKDPGQAIAAAQLEAVKFLCKEFWTEVFRKQIDKLQTNHRGVFVLKDMDLRWLSRLPPNQEDARVAAIQLLAFPCGLVRGALANLGIPAVVSCDFLADGVNMSACSFNIKIK